MKKNRSVTLIPNGLGVLFTLVRCYQPVALLLLSALLSIAQAQVVFEEDFESGNLDNWTAYGVQTPLVIATPTNRVPVDGIYSAQMVNSTNRMYANASTSGLGITAESFKFTYWLYDGPATRAYNEVRSYTSGFDPGSPNIGYNQILAIGKYNNVTMSGEVYNPSKYQARIVFGLPSGWFNLNAPGSPNRSAGWHRFDIERGVNTASEKILIFSVDGIRSRTFTNSNDNVAWDTVILGPGLGTTAGNAWFDGLRVIQGQPFVFSQPQSQTVTVGADVGFTVEAIGNDTLEYQWKKNGVVMPGETSSMLALFNVQTSDSGNYTVVVSNSVDTATSLPAVLVVNPVILITMQPQSQRINVGSNVTFMVVATGEGTLIYQWKKGGMNIGGATSESYTINNVQPGDAGSYTVVVSNNLGHPPQTSTPAVLMVNTAPLIAAIANQTTPPNTLFTLTATTSDDFSGQGTPFADFENFASPTANGLVMFRQPSFSGSTDDYIDTNAPAPNFTRVTDTFPAGHSSFRVLAAAWDFGPGLGTGVPWLRLTSTDAANLGNPVISFSNRLHFDLYTDRDLYVGVGVRENNTSVAIGGDGGTSGALEFVGVTNLIAGTPSPTRLVAANSWTTLDFDMPKEPVRNFNNGNGVLNSTTGKGVLEHLALVAENMSALETYHVYLDNFADVPSDALTFSLDTAPADATIGLGTGIINWIPSTTGGPFTFTVRATDSGGLFHTRSFTVTVAEAPGPISISLSGTMATLTWDGSTFTLQCTTTLTPDGMTGMIPWEDVPGPVTASGYTYETSSGPQKFFRLRN